MSKLIYLIPAFIVGYLFFLVLGCHNYSIIGGILFALMAKEESTVQ